MAHKTAEIRSKKIFDDRDGNPDIVHLKIWVPEENELVEIDLSANKLDDNEELTEAGKRELKNHLQRMFHEREGQVADHEKQVEF